MAFVLSFSFKEKQDNSSIFVTDITPPSEWTDNGMDRNNVSAVEFKLNDGTTDYIVDLTSKWGDMLVGVDVTVTDLSYPKELFDDGNYDGTLKITYSATDYEDVVSEFFKGQITDTVQQQTKGADWENIFEHNQNYYFNEWRKVDWLWSIDAAAENGLKTVAQSFLSALQKLCNVT